jgi:hypothetical protein
VARGGSCYLLSVSFGKKRKAHERFYLLPGQGGRNYHRKQRLFIAWAILVALIFGGALAAAMWWLAVRQKL